MGDPIKFIMKRQGTQSTLEMNCFIMDTTMRDFSYTFDFWLRNMKEAEAVRDIITYLNTIQLRLKGNSGALFAIPNYFKISYMYKGREYKFKFNICLLL